MKQTKEEILAGLEEVRGTLQRKRELLQKAKARNAQRIAQVLKDQIAKLEPIERKLIAKRNYIACEQLNKIANE